ncbi:hypothetical protein [Microbulbifer taiwanensis]|uniref:hypothetical protein n=1 Tax=Microbulbifer taiwanensis TaxID=986746 RepID=UPI00360FD167
MQYGYARRSQHRMFGQEAAELALLLRRNRLREAMIHQDAQRRPVAIAFRQHRRCCHTLDQTHRTVVQHPHYARVGSVGDVKIHRCSVGPVRLDLLFFHSQITPKM